MELLAVSSMRACDVFSRVLAKGGRAGGSGGLEARSLSLSGPRGQREHHNKRTGHPPSFPPPRCSGKGKEASSDKAETNPVSGFCFVGELFRKTRWNGAFTEDVRVCCAM